MSVGCDGVGCELLRVWLRFTVTTGALVVVAGVADGGAADEFDRSEFGGFGLSGACCWVGFGCSVVVFSGEFVEIAIDSYRKRSKEIEDDDDRIRVLLRCSIFGALVLISVNLNKTTKIAYLVYFKCDQIAK